MQILLCALFLINIRNKIKYKMEKKEEIHDVYLEGLVNIQN